MTRVRSIDSYGGMIWDMALHKVNKDEQDADQQTSNNEKSNNIQNTTQNDSGSDSNSDSGKYFKSERCSAKCSL